jgi:7-keto-8-aminopelargonate synthetase-like enzyme
LQGFSKPLVDDAHGFGTLGKQVPEQVRSKGVQDDIDVYFSTLQNQWLTLVHL